MPPTGLRPAPLRAPSRLKSTADLRTLQRLMTHVLVRPLDAQHRMQRRWVDGRPMAQVAAEFIKPNDRLTAFERLELYNRQYWFRLLDNFSDDNPGLRAVLGERKFNRLAEAYLSKYPSRSYTLRNLCSRLQQFIREEPRWTAPHTRLAYDVAQFEWAQIIAFDGPTLPPLTAAAIAGTPPTRLKLALQPYHSLLALDHPVDDFVLALKKQDALRGEASNAMDEKSRAPKLRAVRRPRRERVYLAVHRLNNSLYYKRLDPAAYKILCALRDGLSLSRACASATPRGRAAQAAFADGIRDWFQLWMELGWLCQR
jgi:hypothetical protein